MYNAWYKGRMHGKQPEAQAFIKALAADKEGKIPESVKDMTWTYLEYLESFLPD